MTTATVTVTLTGVAPLSQSKFIPPKKNDQTYQNQTDEKYEEFIWKERMHRNQDGIVFIPSMSIKYMLDEAAKRKGMKIPGQRNKTYSKCFLSGIIVTEDMLLMSQSSNEYIHIKSDLIKQIPARVPSDGIKGSAHRVLKYFPTLDDWTGQAQFIITDALITKDVFYDHLKYAGQYLGLGSFRAMVGGPNGRFDIPKDKNQIEWIESQ